jgi:hypothetical protein
VFVLIATTIVSWRLPADPAGVPAAVGTAG